MHWHSKCMMRDWDNPFSCDIFVKFAYQCIFMRLKEKENCWKSIVASYTHVAPKWKPNYRNYNDIRLWLYVKEEKKNKFWIFVLCKLFSFQIVKNRWKMCLQTCMNRYVAQKYPNFWEINEQHQTHKATQQTINRFHP